MEGQGAVIAKQAPDFFLLDQDGVERNLTQFLVEGPLLLVFYPGDFTPVCTKQLCNYQEHLDDFGAYGVRVVGISGNKPETHAEFVKQYGFKFPLLSDPDKKIAKEYGATSFLMLGAVSRAVFIISRAGFILYRYIEPTILTRRKADELMGIIMDLRVHSLI